jgi:hypothetical protein
MNIEKGHDAQSRCGEWMTAKVWFSVGRARQYSGSAFLLGQPVGPAMDFPDGNLRCNATSTLDGQPAP